MADCDHFSKIITQSREVSKIQLLNKKKLIAIVVTLLLILFGCSDNNSNEDNQTNELAIQSPINFTYNEQDYSIIPFYREYLNYIEEAKKQEVNLSELYHQTVKQPFLVNAFGKEFKDSELEDWTLTTPTAIDKLEETVNLLIKNQNSINKLVEETLKESSDNLKGGKKSVYIIPANPSNTSTMKFLNGVTGVTWEKDVILIQIDPTLLKDEYLKYCLAHEYHHSVFMETNELPYRTTLEHDVILEGKADAFAKNLYQDINIEWHEFTTSQMEVETWKFFKENADGIGLTSKEILFNGSITKDIPERANYTLGNKIMDSFIEENPNTPTEEWTDMTVNEILEKSNYEEKLIDE